MAIKTLFLRYLKMPVEKDGVITLFLDLGFRNFNVSSVKATSGGNYGTCFVLLNTAEDAQRAKQMLTDQGFDVEFARREMEHNHRKFGHVFEVPATWLER